MIFLKKIWFHKLFSKNWEIISKVLWVYGATGDKYFGKVLMFRLMEDCQVFDIVTLKACMGLLANIEKECMENTVLVDLERDSKTIEHLTPVHEMLVEWKKQRTLL
ncbi:hypothetical protein DM860_015940 [Cuscuta australis]|uniref:Uncharacterized protein n=1 Tax=Cuscuta australis TaxID=267555 RepID=A0A328E2Y0_9ASTE|nr:hypothetical protein DM860_015940 [Cuscuta australis]